MSEKNKIYFNYEPTIEIAPGKTVHPPNISRVATLIKESDTPERLEQSGEIYTLIASIEAAQAITAIKAKINR